MVCARFREEKLYTSRIFLRHRTIFARPMKKKILLIVACAAISFSTIAQREVPGYIITLQFDTIRGQLSNKTLSSYGCTFQAAGTSSMKEFKPVEITGFGTDERTFLTKKLPFKDLSEDRFAEVLESGRADLLQHRGMFFLEDSTGIVRALEQNLIRREVNGTLIERYDNQYAQILGQKLIDCEEIRPQLPNVHFNEKSLRQIFRRYNACFGEAPSKRVQKKSRPLIIVGLEAGFYSIAISGNPEQYNQFLSNDFKTSRSVLSGVFISLYPSEKAGTVVTIGVQKIGVLFESQKNYTEAVPVDDHVKVSYDQIKIPVMLGYDFLRWAKIRPGIRFGVAYNSISNIVNERQKVVHVIDEDPITVTQPAFIIKKPPFSLLAEASIGYNYRRLYTNLRIRYEAGVSPLTPAELTLQSMSLKETNFAAMVTVGFALMKRQ
jgi:hypothetical protein